jgi:hypothetical protein
MATKTWVGKFGSDWFVGSSWLPSGIPESGDEVIVHTGAASINGTDPAIDNVQIMLGSDSFVSPANLMIDGGTIGAGATLTVHGGSPFAVVNLKGTALFDATATVTGGGLKLDVGANVTGDGTVNLVRGGSVEVSGTVGAVGPDPIFKFLDDNATLLLDDPGNFGSAITGLQTGDRIELGRGVVAERVSYQDNKLTIFGANGIAIGTLSVSLQGGPVNFFVEPFGHGASAITTSQVNRIWGGGDGDWFNAANWTNGVPVGGDTINITSGAATLSASDASEFGTMDFETLMLGAAGSSTPVSLVETGAYFGPAFSLVVAGTPQYTPTFVAPQATLVANGFTRFQGNLAVESQGGTLTVNIESDGSAAAFVLAGQPGAADADVHAETFAGQESSLVFTGAGAVINDGLVLSDGAVCTNGGVAVQGSGTIEMESGGVVSIAGSVAATQTVAFADETGTLTLGNLSTFQGFVSLFHAAGDEIDVTGIQATSLAYSSGVLSLLNSDAQSLGTIAISDPGDGGASDFTLGTNGGVGSLITYTPQGPQTLKESLPVAAVGQTNSTIPLSTLLTEAFGAQPSMTGYSEYILDARKATYPTESYWQQGSVAATNSAWMLNGTLITGAVTVQAKDISNYSLAVGNSIIDTAWFTVPVAENAGTVAENVQYNIWTVNPAVDAPITAYSTADPSIPGSASRFGQVMASDIVASALRYDTVYNATINSNNCNWIADNVVAGAGAVMPFENASNDPADNQEGGFWRIVYRGSDETNPQADWFQFTQPGDVVRMARIDGGGHHTTTILGTVNPDGTITVYDNGDSNSEGMNIIGIHDATYWTGTDPGSITIYRLDPNQQYLITGTTLTEYLQGSVYNDLIRPSGGDDTIAGGPGNNEVQGTTAQINGITYADFNANDSIDLTDLASGGASASYNSVTGSLSIQSTGSTVAFVALPAGLTGRFVAGTDGSEGTQITLTCFAEGTLIATPMGAVPIQHLSEGSLVLTGAGEALPVVWLGHRRVPCARHPCPTQVLPIRIQAGAFGPGTPARNLLLSPDHAVFVNGVLIPVKYLVNGHGVAQLAVTDIPEVIYWHIELPRHSVVLAENLPVESYLDTGDRANFQNGGNVVIAHPDFSTRAWEAYGCAPLCITGPTLDAARARLCRPSSLSPRRTRRVAM